MVQSWMDYFDNLGINLLPWAIGGLIVAIALFVIWILVLTHHRAPRHTSQQEAQDYQQIIPQEPICATQPAPVAQEPIPAAQPAPVAQEPIPAAQPAPVAQEPIPAARPAPVAQEPIFAVQPAPVAQEKTDPPASSMGVGRVLEDEATLAMPAAQAQKQVQYPVSRLVRLTERQNPMRQYGVLLKPEATLGRDPQKVTLAFPEERTVAREQCRLVCFEGNVYVQDLDSTNGTYVDEVPTGHTALLTDGCVLRLGGLELIVTL